MLNRWTRKRGNNPLSGSQDPHAPLPKGGPKPPPGAKLPSANPPAPGSPQPPVSQSGAAKPPAPTQRPQTAAPQAASPQNSSPQNNSPQGSRNGTPPAQTNPPQSTPQYQSQGQHNNRSNFDNRSDNRSDNRNDNRGDNRGDNRNRNNSNNRYNDRHGDRQNDRRPSAPAGFQIDFEGIDFSTLQMVKPWDELTIIDPQPRLTLEYPGCPASCRLIDLFCPIGRGQRGLIVSPPKAGKTTLLKDIATALLRNHPDLEIVVLLVDERPEEVTDFRRTFAKVDALDAEMTARGNLALAEGRALAEGKPAGETSLAVAAPPRQRVRVIASSNDHNTERHIAVSTQTIERCKRLVEAGKHVVVMLDSLTRLGRAFNQSKKHASSGRTMTGGLDSKALEVPRQIFGSARNTEEAGSLTIIASCLVDTGSQADQIIFEEFKGSGNMELILDRKIAERRMFPAINLAESGTRKEHLLMREDELKTMTALRRRLLSMHPHQQVEQLLAALQRFPTNATLVGSAG